MPHLIDERPTGQAYGPLDYRPAAIVVEDRYQLYRALLALPPGRYMVRCRTVLVADIFFDEFCWVHLEELLRKYGRPYAAAEPDRFYGAMSPDGKWWFHSEYNVRIVYPWEGDAEATP